jgi:protein ImuB
VIACCRAARRRGVVPGMLLAEAQSLWPASDLNGVGFEPHDVLADRGKLRELAALAQQFSPFVAIDDADVPDYLLLDATGCGYGFGGEAAFAEKLVADVRRRGYWPMAAIADTVAAARAVARHGRLDEPRVRIVPPGEQLNALRSLPIEALRLPPSVVQTLWELSIVRVDQLLALPRVQLPSRFGTEVLTCIDRALGDLPEGLNPEPAVELLELSWAFEPPAADATLLAAAVEELVERLLKKLRNQPVGVKRLLWWVKTDRAERVCFPVDLVRPTTSQKDLMALVRLQVERLRVAGEVTEITVRAAAEPLVFDQLDLFGNGPDRRKDVAHLLERLTSRLGDRAVLRPRPSPDAQPELACEYDPWLAVAETRAREAEKPRPGPRPLTRPPVLKSPPAVIGVLSVFPGGQPKRIRWGRRDLVIARSWGPERIETGWWRGDDVRRDYYVAETAAGERFWVFRCLAAGGWFLHGVFD